MHALLNSVIKKLMEQFIYTICFDYKQASVDARNDSKTLRIIKATY